jgi:hypothetical protein
MHMALIILGGIFMLATFLLFGRQWALVTGGMVPAAYAFIAAWFVMTLINTWIGVTRAGYTVMQELPVNAVVFAVPALMAGAVIWQMSR